MRILLCSNYPVFTGSGGAEKVFWEMGDHFASEGNDVMCLGFEKGADPEKPSFHPHGDLVKTVNPGRHYKNPWLCNYSPRLCFLSANAQKGKRLIRGKAQGAAYKKRA